MYERRRTMLASKKKVYTISYQLLTTPAYNYLKINGVGTQFYGSGSFEIEEGDYVYVEAYSNRGSKITLNGKVVAQNNVGTINKTSVYNFYPTSNATITYYQTTELGGVTLAIRTI